MLVLAVLALLVGVAALYVGWRALLPRKRELEVVLSPPAPLLSQPAPTASLLEIYMDGEKLEGEPHVVGIALRNTGRHDIAREAFDSGSPLSIDLSVPVVRALSVVVVPERGSAPEVEVQDDKILLRPTLISRRQEIQVQAIMSGPPTSMTLAHELVDVEVVVRTYEDVRQRPDRRSRVAPIAVAVAVVALGGTILPIVWTLADSLSGRPTDVVISPNPLRPGDEVIVSGAGVRDYALVAISLKDERATAAGFRYELGESQADELGRFTIEGDLPSNFLKGPTDLRVEATDNSGTHFDYLDISVVSP